MIGVGSKRAIATAHAWVLTSKFFFFGEGAFGGQNGARMTWVCAKGHIGLAIFMFVI